MTHVSLTGIRRTFGSVVALGDATLAARQGEVHAVLGENGAGKTTLLSILAGELASDAGSIRVAGAEVRFSSAREAWAAGVGMVHQHFALVDRLTVLENLLLGWQGPQFAPLPFSQMRARAAQVAQEAGLSVDLDAVVERLSVGEKQRVEILKVLLRDPQILILDEPTAVLTPSEVGPLLALLRDQAAKGRTVLIVAHKLDEVLAVADRVTVLRHGHTVLEATRSEVNAAALSTAMVGAAHDLRIDRTRPPLDPSGDSEPVLTLKKAEASTPTLPLGPLTLELVRGEVVGIAGVEGNGQRGLARLLAGIDRSLTAGSASFPDKIGFIPQDRRREGLAGEFSLVENLALGWSALPEFRRGPWLRWGALREAAEVELERFGVRAAGSRAKAETLSGGNQQRVVLAREFLLAKDLLVAENPTRGLDVAGAAFVRESIERLVDPKGGADSAKGTPGSDARPAVVLISTDLDEILALSDRIFVLLRGRLTQVPPTQRTREQIGAMMLGTVSA